MAFFPDQVMPKLLKKEIFAEVDGNPRLYNAHDHNIIHKEIIAIEKFLLGNQKNLIFSNPPSSIIPNTPPPKSGIVNISNYLNTLFKAIAGGGLITQMSGNVQSGNPIPIPTNIINTKTVGTLTTGAVTINVVSTSGFPISGTITKFNALPAITICSDGTAVGGGDRCGVNTFKVKDYNIGAKITNQELITYTGTTSTSFTGCTRGSGTSNTPQSVNTGEQALIVAGRASIMFSCLSWNRYLNNIQNPIQFYIENDAMLTPTGYVYSIGTRQMLAPLATIQQIGYSLMVSGSFQDPDLKTLLGLIN